MPDRTTLDEAVSWSVIVAAFVLLALVDGLRWWWRVLRSAAMSYRFGGQRGNRL